jgi:hypothetical protein
MNTSSLPLFVLFFWLLMIAKRSASTQLLAQVSWRRPRPEPV